VPASEELRSMTGRLPVLADAAREQWRERANPLPDYLGLVLAHNARRRR
jgi:hypothetical protein